MGQELDHTVETLADLERLEDRLLLGRLDVDQARNHVGERAGRLDVLKRGRELRRHGRQELDRLDGLLLEHGGASLDRGVRRRLVGDQVEARGQERQPVQIVDHAEALLALADQVMNAVRRLDVTDDGDRRADLVQIVGARLVDARVLLQHDPELVAVRDGFLNGAHRNLARERDLRDGAREHHDVAHGHDEEHVLGQRGRRRRRLGGVRGDRIRVVHCAGAPK